MASDGTNTDASADMSISSDTDDDSSFSSFDTTQPMVHDPDEWDPADAIVEGHARDELNRVDGEECVVECNNHDAHPSPDGQDTNANGDTDVPPDPDSEHPVQMSSELDGLLEAALTESKSEEAKSAMGNVRIVEGDLLNAKDDMIIHQTNCTSDRAAGLAKAIFAKYPHADVYARRIQPAKPGTIQIRDDGGSARMIVNMHAQYHPGKPRRTGRDTSDGRLRMMDSCLQHLRKYINAHMRGPVTVGIPWRIGCGLAQGDWPTYRNKICAWAAGTRSLDGLGIQVTFYRLQDTAGASSDTAGPGSNAGHPGHSPDRLIGTRGGGTAGVQWDGTPSTARQKSTPRYALHTIVKRSTIPNAGLGLFMEEEAKRGERVARYSGDVLDAHQA